MCPDTTAPDLQICYGDDGLNNYTKNMNLKEKEQRKLAHLHTLVQDILIVTIDQLVHPICYTLNTIL